MPVDGTFPTATAQWEKRNIALEIPEWDEELCIQCGKCVLVCPHAVIRAKVYDSRDLEGAPATFKAVPARWKDMKDRKYTLQVAPEDCTGCTLVRGGLPGQEQERGEAPRHQHGAAAAPARTGSRQLGVLPEDSRKPTARCSPMSQVKDVQLLRPAVRILRRLLRLRRNPLRQADDAALRRPHADRQRHRLLLDLRRQPADHALLHRTTRAAAPRGPIRCLKTTPSSAWACAWRSTSRTNTPASWWRA